MPTTIAMHFHNFWSWCRKKIFRCCCWQFFCISLRTWVCKKLFLVSVTFAICRKESALSFPTSEMKNPEDFFFPYHGEVFLCSWGFALLLRAKRLEIFFLSCRLFFSLKSWWDILHDFCPLCKVESKVVLLTYTFPHVYHLRFHSIN